MKTTRTLLLFLAALALTACSSDPQWADEEAHEKTVELQESSAPLIMAMGRWNRREAALPRNGRFFDGLMTFSARGTFTGFAQMANSGTRHHRRRGAIYGLAGCGGREWHVHGHMATGMGKE